MIKKILIKINNAITFLRSLPYQKRAYLFKISILTTGLILFVVWMMMLPSQITSSMKVEKQTTEVNNQSVGKWAVLKRGVYAFYQDDILPLLKKTSDIFITVFSASVKGVIALYNTTSRIIHPLVVQYKAYAQLIQQFCF